MPPSSSQRDAARLVLRAQLGDREALEHLLKTIQPRLLAFLRQRMSQQGDYEDVLQRVLIQICRRLVSLREPTAFPAWAFRIASREATRWSRRLPVGQPTESAEADRLPAPEPEPFPWPDQLAALPETMRDVPPNSRAVLHLHYLEQLTLAEVSAVLGIPLGTVKSRLSYGLQKLRNAFSKQQP